MPPGRYNPANPHRRRHVGTAHQATLDVFPNPHPQREYEIEHVCPEFTAVCPITGQPDFGTIRIEYVPDQCCVELKSLKLYLWRFRNEGHFYEDVVNLILDDLVAVMDPIRLRVTGEFNVRGGIHSIVRAAHHKPL
jgi:7-cyano-7-deazaguanine reductase